MNGFMNWIEQRIPLTRVANMHAIQYPAPINMNFWYVFGFLSTIVLVNQILTGVWLTMNFVPSAEGAFASVEYIMREIDYGWLIRYMHSTGASAFFIVVYLHMFRGMIYGSYQKPRELLWVFGMLIYLALMAEAFMGYVLPWGQMSYWGARGGSSGGGGKSSIAAKAGTVMNGFTARGCQQQNTSCPLGRMAARMLLNAETGSSKNITPKREKTTSKGVSEKR